MLHEDYSNYCLLFPLSDTSEENTARAIIDRGAAFVVPNGPMSDGPMHIKNEPLPLVSKSRRVPYHFTLTYTP